MANAPSVPQTHKISHTPYEKGRPSWAALSLSRPGCAGLKFVAQCTEHTVIGGMCSLLQAVIKAQLQVVVAELDTSLAAVSNPVHCLCFGGSRSRHAGEAHFPLDVDIASGGGHVQIKRRPYIPAIVQVEGLGELHADGECPDILAGGIGFKHGLSRILYIIAIGGQVDIAHAHMGDDVKRILIELVFGTQARADSGCHDVCFHVPHAEAGVHFLPNVVMRGGVVDVGAQAEVVTRPASIRTHAPEIHVVGSLGKIARTFSV